MLDDAHAHIPFDVATTRDAYAKLDLVVHYSPHGGYITPSCMSAHGSMKVTMRSWITYLFRSRVQFGRTSTPIAGLGTASIQTHIFRREHPVVEQQEDGSFRCHFQTCTQSYRPGQYKNSRYYQHLKKKHMNEVVDLLFDQAYLVVWYLQESFGIAITRKQWKTTAKRWKNKYPPGQGNW